MRRSTRTVDWTPAMVAHLRQLRTEEKRSYDYCGAHLGVTASEARRKATEQGFGEPLPPGGKGRPNLRKHRTTKQRLRLYCASCDALWTATTGDDEACPTCGRDSAVRRSAA